MRRDNQFERYFETVKFIEGLSNIPKQAGYLRKKDQEFMIKRMRFLLEMVGNPDQDLKFIHITGTAGKGSVANMLHSILVAQGELAALFTSPFTTTLIENVKVGDYHIDPQELVQIFNNLEPFINRAYIECPYGGPSDFEILLAIAFLYFQKKQCRWCILEVSLGGRYCPTNVIENPVITVITNIDYDHTQVLGKTLGAIARNKAGIIKVGSHFWTAEQRPRLLGIFQEICQEKGAIFNQIKEHSQEYKKRNVALAISIARDIGISGEFDTLVLTKAPLPCRFEIVQKSPVVVLDGAHNALKMKSTVFNLGTVPFRELYLVIGIAQGKDINSILELVVPMADHIIITRFVTRERMCAHPAELAEQAKKYRKTDADIEIYLDPKQALKTAIGRARQEDLALVTGSFFLAGELRKMWYPEEFILTRRQSF